MVQIHRFPCLPLSHTQATDYERVGVEEQEYVMLMRFARCVVCVQ